jgi:hypothetical protein
MTACLHAVALVSPRMDCTRERIGDTPLISNP